MSVPSTRLGAISIVLLILALTACSGGSPTATTTAAASGKSADFYWSAARETYALGDYMKTADHLEHLLDDHNAYNTRAITWYLVLTSGMADGYMKLADQYTAGARINKSAAKGLRLKASAYRTTASQVALRFAQNADKVQEIPLGMTPLGFPLPKGSAAETELLTQIAKGRELTPADAESAETLAIQHAVLMAACRAAGADNNMARAEEILANSNASVSRATFGKAMADLLDSESALYSRNKLDEPEKLAALKQRAEIVRKEAARVGSARIVNASSVAEAKP
jgi:hypothetical protein